MIGIKYGKRKVVNYRGNQMVVGGLTARNKIDILLYISTEFANSNNQEELFQNVLSLGSEIFEADNITLRIWDGNFLNPIAFLKETEPPRRPVSLSEGFSGKVGADQKSLLLQNLQSDHPDYLDDGENTASICCVPVVYKDSLLGTLAIEKEIPYFFKEDDLEILEAMASQLALALNEVRLIEGLIDAQDRINSDLRMGRTVQSQIILSEIPPWNCLHFGFYYEPMVEVSGDYFDVIRKGNSLTALIADVSGHGVSAALVTMSIHHEFQRCIDQGLGLTETVEVMNNNILPRLPSGTYFTAQLVRVYNDYSYSFVSAGHNQLILFKSLTRDFEHFTSSGVPLGIMEVSRDDYTEEFGRLTPGDLLIMHTDGFIEQRNPHNEDAGPIRFADWLSAAEAKQSRETEQQPYNTQKIADEFLNSWRDFVGNAAREDDLTLLLIGMSPNVHKARSLYREAITAFKAEQIDKAIKLANQSYSLEDSLHSSLYLLSRLYYKIGDYGASAEFMNKYISSSGEITAQSFYLLGTIYFRMQDMQAARLSLKRALSIDHVHEKASIMLARCYLRLKERVKAQKILEQAWKSNPGSQKIRQALDKMRQHTSSANQGDSP